MPFAEVDVPLGIRLRLARAAVQTIADQAHADVLHIKGDAVDKSLRPIPSSGSDVDVLARPDHVRSLHSALLEHGWRVYTTYAEGSPFEHAQTYVHDLWGYLDLHRHFPGIGRPAADAFDLLWARRGSIDVGGVACPVPSVSAQAAILVMNAARSTPARSEDLARLWTTATSDRRADVVREIAELGAHVAFAAATGRLEDYRRSPDYRLWRAVVRRGGRLEEWWGRLWATPTWRGRARLILRAPLVNVAHLSHRLGRPARRAEVIREFFLRPARGLGELWRARGGSS
ncbi:nucleotidyltransferase family protein [Microbacterium aureliae]